MKSSTSYWACAVLLGLAVCVQAAGISDDEEHTSLAFYIVMFITDALLCLLSLYFLLVYDNFYNDRLNHVDVAAGLNRWRVPELGLQAGMALACLLHRQWLLAALVVPVTAYHGWQLATGNMFMSADAVFRWRSVDEGRTVTFMKLAAYVLVLLFLAFFGAQAWFTHNPDHLTRVVLPILHRYG